MTINGLVRANTGNPTGHGNARASGKVTSSGGSFSVLGADEQLEAKLTINGGSSSLKLFDHGVQLGSTYTFTGSLNTFYEIQICWNGTSARAVFFRDGVAIDVLSSSVGNHMAIRGVPGGTVSIDYVTLSKNKTDSPTCPGCGGTTCGEICDQEHGEPELVAVSVSGVTPLPASFPFTVCNSCYNFNNAFIIPKCYGSPGTAFPPPQEFGCFWCLDVPIDENCCNPTNPTPPQDYLRIWAGFSAPHPSSSPAPGDIGFDFDFLMCGEHHFTSGILASPGANINCRAIGSFATTSQASFTGRCYFGAATVTGSVS